MQLNGNMAWCWKKSSIVNCHPFSRRRSLNGYLILFSSPFSWEPSSMSFAEVLHVAGLIPLPPYLHRESVESDKERYQTIYAREEGSVAAPTAGLHFTPAIFESLTAKNIPGNMLPCTWVRAHSNPLNRQPLPNTRCMPNSLM